ncbi:hypothetical protein ACLKA6_017604 [Drosophila palustris]
MKAIADMGKVDLESVIEYIVDGLEMKMEYKFSMYNCASALDIPCVNAPPLNRPALKVISQRFEAAAQLTWRHYEPGA